MNFIKRREVNAKLEELAKNDKQIRVKVEDIKRIRRLCNEDRIIAILNGVIAGLFGVGCGALGTLMERPNSDKLLLVPGLCLCTLGTAVFALGCMNAIDYARDERKDADAKALALIKE